MLWKLEDTPDQASFRKEFREWLIETLEPGWVEAIDQGDEERFSAIHKEAQANGWNFISWMQTIGVSGYAAPHWPAEYGGLGEDIWALRVVREELGKYRLPTFGANILGVGLAGPTIITHGTDEQREKYLADILSGAAIWCQLFSEPGAGSDLASLATSAVRDGDDWVINGQKVWTTMAQISRYALCLTRTDPEKPKHEGLTYFIIDMFQKGVDVKPLYQMTGGAEFCEVFLNDVRVPDSARVGDVGDGWNCARTTLANERDAISGLSLDMASVMGGSARKDPWESVIDKGIDKTDPALRGRFVQAYINREIKDMNLFRVSLSKQLGKTPGAEGSIGKLFNAESNQRWAELQVDASGLGGVAWPSDSHASHALNESFLRSRANTIEGGGSEVLRSQIAERILGLPRDPEPERSLPWSETRRG